MIYSTFIALSLFARIAVTNVDAIKLNINVDVKTKNASNKRNQLEDYGVSLANSMQKEKWVYSDNIGRSLSRSVKGKRGRVQI